MAAVERILRSFRDGSRNVAEFWIRFQERFVHIRYFPVRDAEGKYLGTRAPWKAGGGFWTTAPDPSRGEPPLTSSR